MAEAWKIGRKKVDDGAILLVAKNDRKLRIEVGYGLEGALTDVTAKRIIDEIITPKFRSGDFAGGISDGVDRIIGVIDGEPLPAPTAAACSGRPAASTPAICSIRSSSSAVLVLGGFTAEPARPAGRLGRHRRPGRRDGLVHVSARWIAAGHRRRDRFRVHACSASSIGSSGSAADAAAGPAAVAAAASWSEAVRAGGGGFSGGGGSFGGGGASGSW